MFAMLRRLRQNTASPSPLQPHPKSSSTEPSSRVSERKICQRSSKFFVTTSHKPTGGRSMRHWIIAGAFVCATLSSSQLIAQSQPAFRNTKLPIEDRITDLIGRLTLEEKAQQLNHTNKGLPRLGLPAWGGWNQTLHGVWSKQPTTLFPIATAMGATWDPDLIH